MLVSISLSFILNPHNRVQLVIGHLQTALNILSYPVSPIPSLHISFASFLEHYEYMS